MLKSVTLPLPLQILQDAAGIADIGDYRDSGSVSTAEQYMHR